MQERYDIEVVVPLALYQAFNYYHDAELPQGTWVEVPFAGRRLLALVWACQPLEGDMGKRKPITRVHPDYPLSAQQCRFFARLAAYHMLPLGKVVQVAHPGLRLFKPERHDGFLRRSAKDFAPRSSGQKRVLAALATEKRLSPQGLRNAAGVSASVILGLKKQGVLEAAPPPAQAAALPPPQPLTIQLNDAQQQALDRLAENLKRPNPQPMLLDGVTGSGKTEVAFMLAAEVLARGEQVLFLLPEIALTRQWMQRFAAEFGFEPSAWHSQLTPAQRSATWRAVWHARTAVVVGARSALFLPFKRLGLIVVDEEHEPAFKQNDGLTYHGRNMAVLRGQIEGIGVLLASATPSLESLENVTRGRYLAVELRQRYRRAPPPRIQLVDLSSERPESGQFLAPTARELLQETFAKKEQTLVFLNRRGYAPLLLCRACGYRFSCPQCSSWLVEHRHSQRLQCHLCDYSEAMISHCPSCGESESFVPCGPGVERIRDEVQALLPTARVALFSSDLLPSTKALQDAVASVQSGEVDVLIGTQLLAKGHDFPALTGVIVVDGDLGLSGADLRAGERSFQMIEQVAGRAGRRDRLGRALVQTYYPDAPLMRALAQGDRDAFYREERAARLPQAMPPFGQLAALIVSDRDAKRLDSLCAALKARAPQMAGLTLYGPAAAPLTRIRGWHRRRFLLHAQEGQRPHDFLQRWLAGFRFPAQSRWTLDIDPLSFL